MKILLIGCYDYCRLYISEIIEGKLNKRSDLVKELEDNGLYYDMFDWAYYSNIDKEKKEKIEKILNPKQYNLILTNCDGDFDILKEKK